MPSYLAEIETRLGSSFMELPTAQAPGYEAENHLFFRLSRSQKRKVSHASPAKKQPRQNMGQNVFFNNRGIKPLYGILRHSLLAENGQ